MDLLDVPQPMGPDQHQHLNLYDWKLSHRSGLDVVASHHRHRRRRLSLDIVYCLELDAGSVLSSWVSHREQIRESPLPSFSPFLFPPLERLMAMAMAKHTGNFLPSSLSSAGPSL